MNEDESSTWISVTETQIIRAMQYHENIGGPRDGVTICNEVSLLADVLGTMWFNKQTEVNFSIQSPIIFLLTASNQ